MQHREAYNAHLLSQQQRLQAAAGFQGFRGSSRLLTQRLDHLDRQNDGGSTVHRIQITTTGFKSRVDYHDFSAVPLRITS